MKTTKLFLLAFLSTLLCNIAIADKVFKWTDKNGVVHFSQEHPNDEKIEVITTKTPRAPLPTDTEGAATDEAAPTDAAAANAPADKNLITKDAKACAQAKEVIKALTSHAVVTREGKVMSIKEMNDEMAKARDIIKIHC